MIYQLPSLVPYNTAYISNVKNLEQIAVTNPQYKQAVEKQVKKLWRDNSQA